MSGPSQQDVNYSLAYIHNSMTRLEEVQRMLSTEPDHEELTEEDMRRAMMKIKMEKVLMDCQYVVEVSVKSMFKMVGKQFPKKHGLSLSSHETVDIIDKVSDDFDYKYLMPRAIFLTDFWSRFYELSKYGAPELNKTTKSIFHIRDAERIVEDAEFCLNLSRYLLDHVVEQYDLEHPKPNNDEVDFTMREDPYFLEYQE
jgi:HEPN domain-containing protein